MMLGYREVFRYFQCSKCKCLQICDIPNDISRYYPNNYYSYNAQRTQLGKLKKLKWKIVNNYAVTNKGALGKLIYRYRPNTDLRFLHVSKIKKSDYILDVGCGAGNLLYSLKELGFQNLFGIDPYYNNSEGKKGVLIEKKSIHNVKGSWQLIMFNHSFEHISDPENTLRRVFGLLNRRGFCILRIPTVSSYAWEQYGVKWVQLDAPRHYFLHSIESVEILAQKTGFNLLDIVYDSTSFQFWGSELYQKNIPLIDQMPYVGGSVDKSLFSEKEMFEYERQAIKLNTAKRGDQAIFYLEKKQ